METLALMPSRDAPAFTSSMASSKVRMPPDAFTAIPSGASFRNRATSWAVAPVGAKPVEVFTKSASLEAMIWTASRFISSVR